MAEGKGKAAILLLLLVGGGVALFASKNAGASPSPPAPGPVPNPAGDPRVPLTPIGFKGNPNASTRGPFLPGQKTSQQSDPLPPFPITGGVQENAGDMPDDDPRSPYYVAANPANSLPLNVGLTPRMLPPDDPRSAFYFGGPEYGGGAPPQVQHAAAPQVQRQAGFTAATKGMPPRRRY